MSLPDRAHVARALREMLGEDAVVTEAHELDRYEKGWRYGKGAALAVVRPRTLENPEIALRERAVLAMLRGDEAPRSIAVRFGLPLEHQRD